METVQHSLWPLVSTQYSSLLFQRLNPAEPGEGWGGRASERPGPSPAHQQDTGGGEGAASPRLHSPWKPRSKWIIVYWRLIPSLGS